MTPEQISAVIVFGVFGGLLAMMALKLADWIVKVLRKMLTKTKPPATMGDNFGEHR